MAAWVSCNHGSPALVPVPARRPDGRAAQARQSGTSPQPAHRHAAAERAELYVVALLSLDIDGAAAEASVDDLIGRLRALHRRLLDLKLTA
jgi:hypothetical protein